MSLLSFPPDKRRRRVGGSCACVLFRVVDQDEERGWEGKGGIYVRVTRGISGLKEMWCVSVSAGHFVPYGYGSLFLGELGEDGRECSIE